MGPSSQIVRLSLLIVIVFYLCMDVNLFLRIKFYPRISDSKYEKIAWLSCSISPFCDMTVKAILLDPTNQYILGPLSRIFENLFHISSVKWITPNLISFFHVFVGAVSGFCVSTGHLSHRILGVMLFEIRNLLDDLDGLVSRLRKHVKGERSEVGSMGYYVDGLCDTLGCVALLIGVFVFLKNNPYRQGYMQLSTILPTEFREKDNIAFRVNSNVVTVVSKVLFFALLMFVSSLFWNYYIDLYQDLLEKVNVTNAEKVRQDIVFRSGFFFAVAYSWRLLNPHSVMQYLLMAVLCDKLWEFLRIFIYLGVVLLFFAVCFTEWHLLIVKDTVLFIRENSTTGNK